MPETAPAAPAPPDELETQLNQHFDDAPESPCWNEDMEEEELEGDTLVDPPAYLHSGFEAAVLSDTDKKAPKKTHEERKRENRLNAKLGRLRRSGRLSAFPGISKLYYGTPDEYKQLLAKWYKANGDASNVESTLKIKAGLERNEDEIEEKLTIQQMKDKGFSA